MVYYHIARELGKTLQEVKQLSPQEIAEWVAYFELTAPKVPPKTKFGK